MIRIRTFSPFRPALWQSLLCTDPAQEFEDTVTVDGVERSWTSCCDQFLERDSCRETVPFRVEPFSEMGREDVIEAVGEIDIVLVSRETEG